MGTKKNPKKTPENQTIEELSEVRKIEMFGQLLSNFYYQHEEDIPMLKHTIEFMFDTYVETNEDEGERTDAAWFTQNFINLLRKFKERLSLQQRGVLLKEYVIDIINGGTPYIVEDMFYKAVSSAEETIMVSAVVQFYRSFQSMIDGVKVINGKPVL
ncbi:MAG: hypothetical protein ACPGSD_00155 [Flavobacteriales bacterium]